MSFTYNVVNLSTDRIAQVRLATGQTQEKSSRISDEEISYLLSQNSYNVKTTSVQVLKNLLVAVSQEYDRSTGEVSQSLSQVYDKLKDLLQNATLGLGGISSPTGLHFGGLCSEEFDYRNKDKSVYHGFVSCDKGPEYKPVCDVETLNINENQPSQEESTVTKNFIASDWIQDTSQDLYIIHFTYRDINLFPVSAEVYNSEDVLQDDPDVTIDQESITITSPIEEGNNFDGYVQVTGLIPSESKVVIDEC
jgi:hypothetical protein